MLSRGGFPISGGTNDGDELAGLHVEGYAFEDGYFAAADREAFDDLDDLYDRVISIDFVHRFCSVR